MKNRNKSKSKAKIELKQSAPSAPVAAAAVEPVATAAEVARSLEPASNVTERPSFEAQGARPLMESVSPLQDLLKQLAAQRDDLVRQIGSLSTDLEVARARELEAHKSALTKAIRAAEVEHSAQLDAIMSEQRGASKALGELRAELAAERRKQDAEQEKLLKKQMATVEAELAERRKCVEAELSELRQVRLSDLAEREQSVRDLNDKAAKIAGEAAALSHKAQAEMAVAREDQRRASELVANAVDKATTALQRRLSAKEEELQRECERSGSSDDELARLRRTARAFGSDSPQQVLADLAKLRKAELDLREQLANRPTLEDCERLKSEVSTLAAQSGRNEKNQQELVALRAEKLLWVRGAADLEHEVRRREVEEQRRKALEGQLEKLASEVGKLKALHERPREKEARIKEIYRPEHKRCDGELKPASEMAWLAQIEAEFVKSDIDFPPRLLHSFHTALKTSEWSPLTVLSGVSGTGKSMLPKLYSRFGGINFLSMPVQPNWDSPQSVFGFFNSVDNRFNASSLLRLLAQCSRDPRDGDGLNDQMSLVLLDEMNLAHVELYFSDMLSKLEDRRGDSEVPSLEVDIGADAPREHVPLDRNVLWCGTMNEDETTKTLSDKVLDRGNLLVFPRPLELRRRRKADRQGSTSHRLPRKTWESWVATKSPFSDAEIKPFKARLEQMSEHMESVGRAIGHRVWQSVEYYMANHPLVRAASADNNAPLRERAMKVAFEDQVVQKVMPKLRGIETRGEARRKCLDNIGAIVAEHLEGLTQDFRNGMENGTDSFVWRSATYLSQYVEAEGVGKAPAEKKA